MTTAATTTTDSDQMNPYVWKIAPVIVLGTIMSILDTTIVNVALDTLARELHSTISEIQWVVTGYMLSLAAVIPVSGWASRRFGAKNVWLFSVLMFTLGSALCGFATSTDGADRIPRAAGRRRRHDHARRAADDGVCGRAQEHGQDHGHHRGPDHAGADPRARPSAARSSRSPTGAGSSS